MVQNMHKCPFCEKDMQLFTNEEGIRRLIERIENSSDDQEKVQALTMLAIFYDIGGRGVPQDSRKAHQLWMRAVELGGSKDSHYNLSHSYSKYYDERGVQKDDKKALYHLEEAAMLGDAAARCELGTYEGERGNWDQAKKHWMLSAAAGCESCLEIIKRGKKKGAVYGELNEDQVLIGDVRWIGYALGFVIIAIVL
jgi:TPR repeat protein